MKRDLAAVVADMDGLQSELDARGDARRHFVATYRRTTLAVGEEIAGSGFRDPDWVERWDVAFADLYLGPLVDDLAGRPVPGPWGVAFRYSRETPEAPALRHLLLGMNAHINYDLPQALLAVISDEEFADPALVRLRGEDHARVDDVLSSRVSAEDAELEATGTRSFTDRVLQPANRVASKRFLREARRKVWANTMVLAAARVRSPEALRQGLAGLERLATGKVEDLVRPGPVLLRLGVGGFGVLLPGAKVTRD
jgi:Family of unknown function (DUF5995)